MKPTYQQLLTLSIFSNIPEQEVREILSFAKSNTYDQGVTLIQNGQTPNALFILTAGEVRIYREDVVLAELSPFAVLGEATLANTVATATIITKTKVEVLEFDQGTCQLLWKSHPQLVINVFSSTMERLRRSNENAMHEAHSREHKLRQLVEERTAELENTLTELRRVQQFREQFLANMSHEIRTPMNAVMGMTNLVLNTKLEDKQRFYLERMRAASDNLLHIINDILDLSKIEAGKMELEEIDMSLSEVVDQVRQTLLHKAEEKGLELVAEIDSSLPDVVLGDPVRLNQVIMNLAGNAIKFTERGSVAIVLKPSETGLRIEVIDTGIGIEPGKLQTVFESFSQASTSDARKYGGTGLGLSISQQLVALMDGRIGLESVVGRGSTFYVELPLRPGDLERFQHSRKDPKHVDGSILNGLKILLADDNAFNRIVAVDTLQAIAEVEILEALNGQEVLDQLDESVDLILMDVQMPVLNGYEATRKIRALAQEKLRHVPILALTAGVMRSEIDQCLDAGMNGFVPKPFREVDLVHTIAKIMNR